MLKVTLIELFLRAFPEIFILIWGIHIISKKSIDTRKYIFFSIILAFMSFFVRWLPIDFGVHTIINIVITIRVMVIMGIPVVKSIYSTLLLYLILSVSEFLNMIVLSVLNINVESLSPLLKCLSGVPSLIMTVLFILIIRWVLNRKEGIKYVAN